MAAQDDVNAKLADLSAKADTLQATVDAKQQAIVDHLAKNDATIADLTAQIAALQAANPTLDFSGFDAVAAKLQAANDDLAATAV